MKKFSVKLAAALAVVLIFSTIVVSASAATIPNSRISCGNNNSTYTNSTCADRAQCLFGLDLASRLGILNLSRCANGGSIQPSGSTSAPGSSVKSCFNYAPGSSANNASARTNGASANSGFTAPSSSANSASTCAPGSSTNSASKNAFASGNSTAYPVSNSLNSIIAQYRTEIEKFCGTNYVCPGTQTVKNPSTGSETPVTPPVKNDTTPADSGAEPDESGTPATDNSNTAPATDSDSAPADSGETAEPTNNASIDNLSFEQQVATLVNEQRAANGLAPLTLSQSLSNVARAKSQDMHDNNYFSHNSPTYGSPFDMLRSFGISYRTAGENIAMGYSTPEAVMNGWMNSPGHRANILNANYTQIGVGYVANGNYWTQEFIG